jgi:hypothetical protein
MADFSYRALLGALTQQPQSLWQGLEQTIDPQQSSANMSPLGQMQIKQQQLQDPRAFMPTINPGRTWGGRDKNNLSPLDVQMGRTYGLPQEDT